MNLTAYSSLYPSPLIIVPYLNFFSSISASYPSTADASRPSFLPPLHDSSSSRSTRLFPLISNTFSLHFDGRFSLFICFHLPPTRSRVIFLLHRHHPSPSPLSYFLHCCHLPSPLSSIVRQLPQPRSYTLIQPSHLLFVFVFFTSSYALAMLLDHALLSCPVMCQGSGRGRCCSSRWC